MEDVTHHGREDTAAGVSFIVGSGGGDGTSSVITDFPFSFCLGPETMER